MIGNGEIFLSAAGSTELSSNPSRRSSGFPSGRLNESLKPASRKSKVKLRDANTYTDQKMLEMYKYFDSRTRALEASDAAQAVTNQRMVDSFEAVHTDINCVKNELYGAIRNEAEKRCCGDNSIVTYANATFYPKMVADITPGTGTTAQPTYNPLPRCGCNCNG